MDKQWGVYVLECKDGTYYTGITENLQRRLAAHNCGKGAKYTRGRYPVVLKYWEVCVDHSAALRREIGIKTLTRAQKQTLIQQSKEGCEA